MALQLHAVETSWIENHSKLECETSSQIVYTYKRRAMLGGGSYWYTLGCLTLVMHTLFPLRRSLVERFVNSYEVMVAYAGIAF